MGFCPNGGLLLHFCIAKPKWVSLDAAAMVHYGWGKALRCVIKSTTLDHAKLTPESSC